MSGKKFKIRDHEIIPITSLDRMKRWHLCQQIGVLYYESQVSYDQLLQAFDYLVRKGVVS